MTAPWERNVGKFDRPSSSTPARQCEAAIGIDRQLLDAHRQGVRAIGTDTITNRIDAAMAELIEKGHGTATGIYLVDADLMALREAAGQAHTYRDTRVSRGASSKAYSSRGRATVRRPKRQA